MNQSPIIHCLYAPNLLLQLLKEVQWNLTKKKKMSLSRTKKKVLRAVTSEICIHNLNHFKETHWIVHLRVVWLILLRLKVFVWHTTIITCTCFKYGNWSATDLMWPAAWCHWTDIKIWKQGRCNEGVLSLMTACVVTRRTRLSLQPHCFHHFSLTTLIQTVSLKPSLRTQPTTL